MNFTQDTIINVLESIYEYVLEGLPAAGSVTELGDKYLGRKDNNPELAAESLIKRQTAKCAASGFLSGIGGAIVLPFTVPADVAANFYVQMRMSAAIAHMYGFDVRSEEVKTFIFLSLIGEGVMEVLKGAGIDMGTHFTKQTIKSMSKDLIFKVNRAIGMRLLTKFGEKGAIKLGRLVPLAGGLIGAGVNSYYCVKVGAAAIEIFSGREDVSG
ncbi:MAG TPA: EcsC family protein [Bacteriovoracaceae bacterium]|nr:EcsC family protein [Bacteriovoracaceae bacterium]